MLLAAAVFCGCSKSDNVSHPSFVAGIWESESGTGYTYQLIVNNRDSEIGPGKYCRLLRFNKSLGGAETIVGQLEYNPQSGEGNIQFKGSQAFVSYTSLYAEEQILRLFSKTEGEQIPELTFTNKSYPTIMPVHWRGDFKDGNMNVILYLSLYSLRSGTQGSIAILQDGEEFVGSIKDLKYDAASGKGTFTTQLEGGEEIVSLTGSFQYVVISDSMELTLKSADETITVTVKAAQANPYDLEK